MSKDVGYKLDRSTTDDLEIIKTASSCWDEEELAYHNMQVAEALRQTMARKDLTEEEKVIVQRLVMKSFHLPGNSFWQDWYMFVTNNHIILSFCLAHPLHPFGKRERVINLMASLAFGLIATCCVVLYYFFTERDMNKTVIYFDFFGLFPISISSGMIFLGIFGGMCNVFWDFGVWFLQACPPCQPGGLMDEFLSEPVKRAWIWMGSHIAAWITLVGLIMACWVTALRASVIDDGDPAGLSTGIEDYAFVASFFMEVAVAQFIMFPVVAGSIFSGIFGCGRVPGLGGRAYQVRKEEKENRRKQQEEERSPGSGRKLVLGERPKWGDKSESLEVHVDYGIENRNKTTPLISNKKTIELQNRVQYIAPTQKGKKVIGPGGAVNDNKGFEV